MSSSHAYDIAPAPPLAPPPTLYRTRRPDRPALAVYPKSLRQTLAAKGCTETPAQFALKSGLTELLLGLLRAEQSIESRRALKKIGMRVSLPSSKAVN